MRKRRRLVGVGELPWDEKRQQRCQQEEAGALRPASMRRGRANVGLCTMMLDRWTSKDVFASFDWKAVQRGTAAIA